VLQPNELITFFLGLFVLVIMLWNEGDLKRFSFWGPMKLGFMVLVAAWAASVLEGFLFSPIFNTLEHILYALAAFIWMRGLVRLSRGRA